MDNSSLGNKTTSMTVNFTVQPSVWDSPIITEYSLTEDDVFSAIDLISMIKPIPIYQSTVTFSYTCEYDFPSFNIDDADVLGAGNIPEFTPRDADVGENLVEITANVTLVGGEVLSAVKVFNFTVFYISDDPILKLPINIDGGSFNSDHFEVLENVDATFKLFVQDWDFSIPQKSFYNEVLDITETIVGPNDTLIKFGEGEFSEEDLAIKRYEADFTSRDMDVGDYNITLEVTDANGASETVEFNLTIIDVIYGLPVIYLPLENHEFNFEEGVEENLEFKANHTIGDNLSYSWYINDILRYSEISFGDGRVQNWLFTPNYVDETYGEKINLTLIVSNPIYPNLNTTRIWNLTIAHRNEPINFSADLIDDFDLAYNANDEFDLKTYFSDADYEDEAYKQNVSFFISSNIVPSRVNRGRVSENWTFILSALEHVSFYEVLNITGCDLNETIVEDVLVVENISCVTSNNFIVNFTDPQLIQIQVPAPSPSPSGGGGGAATNKIISLKLIMPGRISAFENDKIDVPLELTNKGTVAFHGLNLSNVAFKDGDIANEVETLLDQTFFETLAVGESKNLTLSILFNTDKLGDYEVLINISSKTPKYSDWGKMYINLQRINESEVRELLIFTEALIVENPQCIEISEVIEEANNHFKEGDFTSARIKAEKAINACRESIAQVSVPRKESTSFKFLIYLIIGVIISFISGILFYFVQRWRISRKIGKIQQAPIDKKIQKI